MERTRWTDERLDDRMSAIDRSLDQLSADVAGLRAEMKEGFAALRVEMHQGFAALRSEMSELRGELLALHRQMNWSVGGFAIAVIGLLGSGHF